MAAAVLAVCVPGLGVPASGATIEAKALGIAASKQGDPYQWGAAGPGRFDCSGLTAYAFREAGIRLPRTAQGQYASVRHVPPSSRQPGDLVFFHQGDSVYHVGIYAGNESIWNAPHSGSYVRLDRIWSTAVWYGRIP